HGGGSCAGRWRTTTMLHASSAVLGKRLFAGGSEMTGRWPRHTTSGGRGVAEDWRGCGLVGYQAGGLGHGGPNGGFQIRLRESNRRGGTPGNEIVSPEGDHEARWRQRFSR